jgi:diguanylate cyclase (GGDEF)-like protein
MIDGKVYQFVIYAVKAPIIVGYAGMGFEIKKEFSSELKNLINLDVSFVRYTPTEITYLSGTLDDYDRLALERNLHSSKQGEVFEYDQLMSLVVPVARQDSDLVAVLQVPLSKVLSPFSGLNIQLFILALLFSIVAGTVALFLARSVTRPVRLLANIAQRIARGDYKTPLQVKSNDELGDLAKAFITMQDAIGEREQQVIYQSEHDPLTNLPNRSRVFPELSNAIDVASQKNSGFSLLMVDIRNFTEINDELSQEIGDAILSKVAFMLSEHFALDGKVLRFGSDEFLCLVSTDPLVPSVSTAEKIHALFKSPLVLGQIQITVEVNIGIANYPYDADSAENLLRRSSLALNYGRANSRNTCSYEQGWDELHLRRLHLFREFEKSLRSNHISLNYQPKINLDSPDKLGAEALVRWNHPQMGFIGPDEFIAVIESSGQITMLTRWVLKEAIQQLKKMLDKNINITFSVNLSALDLLVDDLPDYVGALLIENQVPAGNLFLEITEGAIMREADKCLHNLKRLEALGVILSIDDFGTGYSSLSQLKKLPVSELKIDKSFILNLDTSDDDMLIVRSTIELGHTMGLSVTAEGVETEAIKSILIAYGCDTAQGYLYSKPLPADKFMQWVDQYFVDLAS